MLYYLNKYLKYLPICQCLCQKDWMYMAVTWTRSPKRRRSRSGSRSRRSRHRRSRSRSRDRRRHSPKSRSQERRERERERERRSKGLPQIKSETVSGKFILSLYYWCNSANSCNAIFSDGQHLLAHIWAFFLSVPTIFYNEF